MDISQSKNIAKIAKKYNIEAKIIGHCEKSPNKNKNMVEIKSQFGSFTFT